MKSVLRFFRKWAIHRLPGGWITRVIVLAAMLVLWVWLMGLMMSGPFRAGIVAACVGLTLYLIGSLWTLFVEAIFRGGG